MGKTIENKVPAIAAAAADGKCTGDGCASENDQKPMFEIGENNEIVWKEFDGTLDKKRRSNQFPEEGHQPAQFMPPAQNFQEGNFQPNQEYQNFQPNPQFQQFEPNQQFEQFGHFQQQE